MMYTQLGPDARILAINSMFTKMERMEFRDGSLCKEVSSAIPSCQNASHQRNTVGHAEIMSPKLVDTHFKSEHILLLMTLFFFLFIVLQTHLYKLLNISRMLHFRLRKKKGNVYHLFCVEHRNTA